MSSRFYFTNSDDSTSNPSDPDPDNDASLPFPKPLARSSFLLTDFDPTTFLSSLSNRFQTLEDLQDELRELNQALNRELVDLVNNNYQDFLSLGSTLAGGEEKVEEIRVGLLGFQRDVGGIKEKVDTRRRECEILLTEKKTLRREIGRGRVLLEIAERIEELEDKLRINQPTSVIKPETQADNELSWSDGWDDDTPEESDDEYDSELGISTRLRDLVEKFRVLRLLTKKYDAQHPFLMSHRERLTKIRDTIRIDLETTLRQEEDLKVKQKVTDLVALLDA